ncbi:MAG: tetratricopeptide repeat protein [Pseudobdellovibrionaceae bacterium]
MIRAILITILFSISACSSQEQADYKQAHKEISQQHYRIGLNLLDRIIKRNSPSDLPLAASREAARIAFFELKDFDKAIQYHRFIVLHSLNEKERVESQKQIAGIYFNNLQNYKMSIVEYSKLQEMPHTDLEAAQYKISMARAQYYLNNFFQADSEIDTLLKLNSDDNLRFSALMLKGNILVGKKDFKAAAEIFKNLLQKFPEKAEQENVALTLAVCYEENFDFKNALSVLEQHRNKYNPREYIELRIKRLQERMKNAPGARGYRK